MADVSDLLGGQYLHNENLPQENNGHVVWRVTEFRKDTFQGRRRGLLCFDGTDKALVLNQTNLKTLVEAWGTESDLWIGRPLELYRDWTTMQGRTVACIRLRIPQNQVQPQTTMPPYPPQTQQPAVQPYPQFPAPQQVQPYPQFPPPQPHWQQPPQPAPQQPQAPQQPPPAAPQPPPAAPQPQEPPPEPHQPPPNLGAAVRG